MALSDTDVFNLWANDFVQKNPTKGYKTLYPEEYTLVAAYINGGSEPPPAKIVSKLGKGLVAAERERRAGSGTTPTPTPDPPPTPSSGFNWFPGHYVLAHAQSDMHTVVTDPLCSPFTGFQTRFYWNECEGAQGDYSKGFAQLDAMLNLVGVKKLIVQLHYKRNDSIDVVPSYMLQSPYCSSKGVCGQIKPTSATRVAMLWNAQVAARFAAFCNAMVKHCAASPKANLVAGFVVNETSVNVPQGDPVLTAADYDANKYMDGIKQFLTSMKAASDRFPYIYYHEGGIYGVNAQQIMSDWLKTQTHIGVGTPDLQPLSPKGQGWPGTVNQDKYPCWPAVQAPDYGDVAGRTDSLDHTYHYGVDPAPDGLHASVITWAYNGSGVFTFADVSKYIPTHKTVQTLPTGW